VRYDIPGDAAEANPEIYLMSQKKEMPLWTNVSFGLTLNVRRGCRRLRRVGADQMTDAVLEGIGVAVLHARGGLEADDRLLVLAVFCRVVRVFEKLQAAGELEGRLKSHGGSARMVIKRTKLILLKTPKWSKRNS